MLSTTASFVLTTDPAPDLAQPDATTCYFNRLLLIPIRPLTPG